MRNHFHLVIETSQPNLVAGMKWLLGTYTTRGHPPCLPQQRGQGGLVATSGQSRSGLWQSL